MSHDSENDLIKEAKGAAVSIEQKGYFALKYRCPYCYEQNFSKPVPDSEWNVWSTVRDECKSCHKQVAVLMD